MFHIFGFISVSLFTSFDGNKTAQCSEADPCKYETVKKRMKIGDSINFIEKNIFDPIHIESFRNISCLALSLGVSINGNNTLINGMKLPKYYFPAFLSFEYFTNVSISGFVFTQFPISIVQCKSSFSSSSSSSFDSFLLLITNCFFFENEIDEKISTITFGTCNVIINNVNMSLCSAHDCSIISAHNSKIQFLFCNIDNVFTFHSSFFPLYFIVNTSLKISNSIFIRNNSPYSPMFVLDSHSNMDINCSSFVSNQNTEIFLCESTRNIIISNSLFFDNFGTLISTSIPKIAIGITNSKFDRNFSPNSPFFDIMNSTVHFDNCEFTSVSGLNLFSMKGFIAKIDIRNSFFQNNQLASCLIESMNGSQLFIQSSSFSETYSESNVIEGDNFSLIIKDSVFMKSYSPVISANKSQIEIFNSTFGDTFSVGRISILCRKSKVNIRKSTFPDRSLSNVFLMSGDISLQGISFGAPKEFALSASLLKNCDECQFGRIEEEPRIASITKMMVFLYIFILVLILLLFRKRYAFFFHRFCIRKTRNL